MSAAGMLADFPLEMPAVLQSLATASARMYPEFVHELQDESGMNVDLRDQGTIFLPRRNTSASTPVWQPTVRFPHRWMNSSPHSAR